MPQPSSGYPQYPPQQQPYTQYQQPPLPPRKPPSAFARFAAFVRRHPILSSIVGVALVIMIIVASIQNAQSPATSPIATPVTQAQATTAPTSVPTAVPTQVPAPTTAPTTAPASSGGLPATHGAPRLGGQLGDFIGAYGQPNSNSNPPLFDFQEVNNVNEVMVLGLGSSCSSTQCEVQQQIDSITVQSPDQANGFTVSEAEAKCMAFGPTDAHFKQKIPYADGTGYDMVYSSSSLAKAFPASEFMDGNSNQVAAGTFDVSYLYADNKVGIGSCAMLTGETQTNG
jgi:hypothetical protein